VDDAAFKRRDSCKNDAEPSAAVTPRTSSDKCSALTEMGDRSATIDTGRKVGVALSLFGGIGEGRKPKQLQGTSSDVEWPVIPDLIITLEGKR